MCDQPNTPTAAALALRFLHAERENQVCATRLSHLQLFYITIFLSRKTKISTYDKFDISATPVLRYNVLRAELQLD